MSIKRLSHLFLATTGMLLAAAGLRGAEAGIEFTGFVRDEKGLSFALRGVASGNVKWVALGQSFEDYTVRSLDETVSVLVVAKDGAEFRLPLVQAKVKKVDSEPPPEVRKRVMNNLRQLAAAADQFFLEKETTHASYDDLVGETKYVRKLEPMDGEDYKAIQFAQGKPIQVVTGQGYVIAYRP